MNRRTSTVFQLRLFGNPPFAGEHGNTKHGAKNNLRKAGMNDRQPVMKQPDHYLAAQNGLYGAPENRKESQPPQPNPALLRPEPNGQDGHKNPQTAPHRPPRKLKTHAPF